MTIEELTAALEKAQASITKLEAKNSELIDREKEAKRKADEAEDAREEAAAEAAKKSGDIESITASLKTKHTKELKALQDQLDTMTGNYSKLVIDDAITKSMVDAKIPAHLHNPMRAMFKTEAKLADGVAMHGDTPLADYLTAYWASDEGKAFIPAPVNVGTGSGTVSSASEWANKPSTPAEIEKFMRLSVENPELHANLSQRFGM